ncbi:magnesium transporter CorA [Actinoplanes sp. SE50]|uniref:magnesium and cobalt transport protein CorA n=1 Tax=unclassified Actinoplanes TaxID=2626549 RepID=UPI00023ECFC9|nr:MULTISPECIES: magnesium and cobalt transport protein CorA [unclassified Actinoplanes]AEV82137.1 Zinc transport protein zntB [Actinoplanes sp. SE50/110]ATO80536.1 magnesium transporter CorA [Actinoplanes sp. SE50]SLL97942.1 magnesium transporter CorA [Actinoplanes sp. SE50/110]
MLGRALQRPFRQLLERLTGPPGARPALRHGNPDAVVDCAVYAGGLRRAEPGQPRQMAYAEAARMARRRRNAFVWLGLHEPDRPTMDQIAEVFGLHELLVERATGGGHRPGVQTVGEVTRLVLRTARYVEHDRLTATSEVVETGDITVLVGAWFVITVRHGPVGPLWQVRQELESRPEVLRHGPWAVAYAVGSRLVDNYLDVAGHVERDLERLEEETFSVSRGAGIAHIYQLKREMVEFKRAVLPLADPLAKLLETRELPAALRPYLVDVRGRLSRAVDRVAGFDDLVNSILQARLAQISIDQNDDMRKIAAWAAIAAVPTVIAGIYGMNFEVIPGLDSPYGFSGAMTAMAVLAGGLYWRLKRTGWL